MKTPYQPTERRIAYLIEVGRECKTCFGTGEDQETGSWPCRDCEGTGEAPVDLGIINER
jgi:DnaJ-class molecular chaperone